MADSEKTLGATSLEKAEHIHVNGVEAKRVLCAGFDGTDIQDLKVDTDGELAVNFQNPTIEQTDGVAHNDLGIVVSGVTAGNAVQHMLVATSGAPIVNNPTAADLNCTEASASAIKTAVEALDNAVDGNYLNVNMNIAGTDIVGGAGAVTAQTVRITQASDSPEVVSVQIMDDWDESDRCKVNLIASQAGITGGAGAVAANTPRVTHASDDPVTTAVQLIDNCISGNEAQVDIVSSVLPTGAATEATLTSVHEKINSLKVAIEAIRGCMGIAADIRVTLLSGTVTTVSSLTNIVSIGSINANMQVNALMNLAYIQSNHLNVTRS